MPDGPDPLYGWIDESGDPSANPKTSRWFVLALVLETGEPGALTGAMSEIKKSLPRRAGAPIVPHFSELRRTSRDAAHRRLASTDFTAIVVAVDAHAVSAKSPLRMPRAMYAHALSAAIGQGAELANRSARSLDVVVEDSPILDLGLLRAPPGSGRAASGTGTSADLAIPGTAIAVHRRRKSSDLRLGAADGLANAFFNALERGADGDARASAHADMHLSKLWRGAEGEGAEGRRWIVLPRHRATRAAPAHHWLARRFAG